MSDLSEQLLAVLCSEGSPMTLYEIGLAVGRKGVNLLTTLHRLEMDGIVSVGNKMNRSNKLVHTYALATSDRPPARSVWMIIDQESGHPYLTKKIQTEHQANELLDDLLSDHRDTEWAARLQIKEISL